MWRLKSWITLCTTLNRFHSFAITRRGCALKLCKSKIGLFSIIGTRSVSNAKSIINGSKRDEQCFTPTELINKNFSPVHRGAFLIKLKSFVAGELEFQKVRYYITQVSRFQRIEIPTQVLFGNRRSISKGKRTFADLIPKIDEEALSSEIKGASLDEDRRILQVEFDGSVRFDYPLVWLRDNCRCSDCYDPVSYSRVLNQQLLKRDNQPRVVSSTKKSVNIIWDDGHESNFPNEWLYYHSFAEDHRKERSKGRYFGRTSWNAKDYNDNPAFFRKFSLSDVLNDDLSLLNWLEQLAKYGLSILTEAPTSSGQLEKIADRIAFIRKTHYGEQFSVIGLDDANNVAYKKGALQLHTDLPYYKYLPGVVLLHCIKPSAEGGENILSDGLNAVSQLSTKAFKILSEVIVDWVDIGTHENKRFYTINREPVLCLNSCGELEKINWSQPQRDSVFNESVMKVIDWYNAAIEFSQLIHDDRNAVSFKSQTGDILTFDNRRILHGRKNYADANRLLYGAYIDWDEIYSKMRVLQMELK